MSLGQLPESSRKGRAAGFTLVEVIVALTLLAVAGGAFLAAQASIARVARKTLDGELAFLLARSRLFEAAANPDRPPPEDGLDDVFEGVRFLTRIEYRDVPIAAAPEKTTNDHRLVHISVRVSWGLESDQSVVLSTYRSVPSRPPR